MAADVTLLALPASDDSWRAIAVARYDILLPGDKAEILNRNGEVDVVTVDHDGLLHGQDGLPAAWPPEPGWTVVDLASGEERERFCSQMYRGIDFLEVGPVSYLGGTEADLPAPTVAVGRYWETPRLVQRAAIAETMVCMNLPDRSRYRTWDKPGRRQVKHWLTKRIGWIAWTEAW